MSGTKSRNVLICEAWYKAFENRKLDDLMAMFVSEPRVTVGSGGSHSAVDYAGTFVGAHDVRQYYAHRFHQAAQPNASLAAPTPSDVAPAAGQPGRGSQPPIRTRCAIIHQPCEFGFWVIFHGEITDHHQRIPTYDGGYLHVFTIDEAEKKVASLDMFLQPSKRLAPP